MASAEPKGATTPVATGSQRPRRVTDGIGQGQNRPAGPKVLVELRRNLRIAVRCLQDQQPIYSEHLVQSLQIADRRLQANNVVDAMGLQVTPVGMLVTARIEVRPNR